MGVPLKNESNIVVVVVADDPAVADRVDHLLRNAGEPALVRGLSRDQRDRDQRLHSIGLLAAGVAHDFGNLLTLGTTALEQLRSKPCDRAGTVARANLDVALAHARDLTGTLLAFAAPERDLGSPAEALDLGDVCAPFVEFLRRVIPARVQLTFERDMQPAWTLARAVQIRQIVMNLVLNARDALSGFDDAGQGHIGVRIRHAGDLMHLIEVVDDGPGIAADALPHVFEAFYSARPRQASCGLGLAIVRAIAEELGGSVEISNRTEGGASARVWLPVAAPPAKRDDPYEEHCRGPAAVPALVAVVEDNDYVRRVVADGLKDAGYRVSEWSRAVPLLEAIRSGEIEPDVAIIDHGLPDMNGDACLEGIRALGCAAPLLLMTGSAEGTSRIAHAVLRKPFSIADLARAVREAIGTEATR